VSLHARLRALLRAHTDSFFAFSSPQPRGWVRPLSFPPSFVAPRALANLPPFSLFSSPDGKHVSLPSLFIVHSSSLLHESNADFLLFFPFLSPSLRPSSERLPPVSTSSPRSRVTELTLESPRLRSRTFRNFFLPSLSLSHSCQQPDEQLSLTSFVLPFSSSFVPSFV